MIREVTLTFRRGRVVKAVASFVQKDGSLAIAADRIERKTICDEDAEWDASEIEWGGGRKDIPYFKLDVFEKAVGKP